MSIGEYVAPVTIPMGIKTYNLFHPGKYSITCIYLKGVNLVSYAYIESVE